MIVDGDGGGHVVAEGGGGWRVGDGGEAVGEALKQNETRTREPHGEDRSRREAADRLGRSDDFPFRPLAWPFAARQP